MRGLMLVWLTWAVCACSNRASGASNRGDASDAGGTGAADLAPEGGSPSGTDGGVVLDAGPPAADADAGMAKPPADPIPLPDGSREFDGIVNLVDEEAAAQLEEFMLQKGAVHLVLRQGLTKPANLFLEHYPEEYDFLFFFSDHTIQGAKAVGKFEAVNSVAAPGAGNDIEIRAGGYRTNGRLMGVAAFPYFQAILPPAVHEAAHFWMNSLDPAFGFGETLTGHVGPHWGLSSVNGHLGGFDGSTLRCVDPVDGLPPGCNPVAGGRFRYVVKAFYENSNASTPFSELELYLMGFGSADDVPASFQLLTEAETVPDSYDMTNGTVVVEASGIKEVTFAQIVARHGKVERLPAAERHLRAAFVVVSAAPADDAILEDVATWAAVIGNRETIPGWASFEDLTSGLATMDTQLGPRRDRSDTAPEARERLTCNVAAQDCPRADLGCYGVNPPVCALAGDVSRDGSCDVPFTCEPGLDCASGASTPDVYVCTPYCDAVDATSSVACETLCPSTYLEFFDPDGNRLGAYCPPP